ncbi:MAG: PAS domain S-box protein [Hyphomicrobiaceae bacterium]|nr:PAS domain S-box protein [Hyphomicrobiaceae bacterium]
MAYIPVESGPIVAGRGRRLGPWTVAEYLTAYGMAVVAPILIFSGLVLHRYIAIENAQLEQQALQTVRALRSDVDRELGGVIVTLEALAASPGLASADYASFHGHASALVRERSDRHIVLSDAAGQPLADTRAQWGEPIPVSSGQAGAREQVLRTARPYVSDPLPGQSEFVVTVPVMHAGQVGGLISLSLDPVRFSELLNSPRLPTGWNAAVVDRRGNIVARSRGYQPGPGAAFAGSASQPRSEEEQVGYATEHNGEVLRAQTPSRRSGWLITASVAPSIARPPFWSWGLFALGGATLLGASALLALYFGRRLARPIRMTALAATAFGKGEAMPQLGLRLREVDEVLNALRTASAQRRLAEDQLRIAHERMTLALSATDMGMWERDLATNRVTWSEAMYRIFGRSPEEFSGEPDEVLSYVHPDDRVRFRKAHQDAVRGPVDTFEQEFRILGPSGAVRWLYRRAFVRRDPDGAAISVLGVAIDITGRKEAESVNAHLAAIVASSSEAILSVSPDGVIATWNAGAEQTFGCSSSEAVGMSLQELFADDGLADHGRIRTAMQAGETVRLESLCRSRDRHPMEVAIVANPVRSPSQSIAGYSITIRDISARKEHDRHLASVMRELTHRSKNLLAIIQAMARQTALRSDGIADFETRFSGRLQSLSRSHELLISNDWEGALLGDLVAMQRSAFGARHSRIRASGPDIFLRPEAILNIGLALHELASNAERHGALSTTAGRVELGWTVERRKDGAQRLMIVWRERGRQSAGDLLHRGFGRDILEHVAPTALGAGVVLKGIPDGLLWALDVPGDQFARGRRMAAANS